MTSTGSGASRSMPRSTLHSMLALLVLVVLAACADDVPTSVPRHAPPKVPAVTPDPSGPTTDFPGPRDEFPPLLRPGIIYVQTTALGATTLGRTRYVLYEDSTFGLQYASNNASFEYAGKYSQADSLVSFRFDANQGTWTAEGIVRADSLIVKYDDDMTLNDFEDAVYRSSASLAEDIYLANADGSAIVRLIRGDWPAWSPDGSRIAFHRNGRIHVIDVTGANEIALVGGGFPSWSPDGTRITFVSPFGIELMNADGSGVTTLIRHDFRDDTYPTARLGLGRPTWSPDGERIAFEHAGDGGEGLARIYVMNADGSSPHLVTDIHDFGLRHAESDPSWSPDGSRIVFWSYDHGIASVPSSGGIVSSVYANFPAVASGARPTWSPDGTTIVFSLFNRAAIWTVPASGGEVGVLIPGGYNAAWAPGGGRIAFVASGGN
jgi:Tol biopolymer transport system component